MTNTTTLASIPPEEMTPAYIELKVFADEFKTKRIQLGYTQGAVGQSLAIGTIHYFHPVCIRQVSFSDTLVVRLRQAA